MPDPQVEYYMDMYIKNAQIKACSSCPYYDETYGCGKEYGLCPAGKVNYED